MPETIISTGGAFPVSSVQRASIFPLAMGVGLTFSIVSGDGAALVQTGRGDPETFVALVRRALETQNSLRTQFSALAARWVSETSTPSSNFTDLIANWAYQRIIGMGPQVVPLILAELARYPDHWGPALEAITGENPAPPEAAGDPEAIAGAWLAWGRARGLIA